MQRGRQMLARVIHERLESIFSAPKFPFFGCFRAFLLFSRQPLALITTMSLILPPTSHETPASQHLDTAADFVTLQRSYTLLTSLFILLLFYDWFINLGREIDHFWRRTPSSFQVAFLTARYLSLLLASFTGLTWIFVKYSDHACSVLKVFPLAYTLVGFTNNVVLAFRTWALCGKGKRLRLGLFGLLGVFTLVELAADLFVKRMCCCTLLQNESHSVPDSCSD